MTFTDSNISIANQGDAAEIVQLLNSAYRGESSKKGWTTEAGIIAGDQRTNMAEVEKLIKQPGSVFLIYRKHKIAACVNLQQHDQKIYLGMLSVKPELQGSGIGKKLLLAAEAFALIKHCTSAYMTVIDVRAELIDWYKRHGYADAGIRKPFEEDGVSGKHLQPLHFMTLEKKLVS